MREHLLDLCDVAAEALILVDVEDDVSLEALVAAFERLIEAFGEDLPADHPAYKALWAARAVETEGAAALSHCEAAFGEMRRHAEALPDATAPASEDQIIVHDPAEQPAQSLPVSPPMEMPLSGDDELLRDFSIRAVEHLDDADEQLLRLEANPSDQDGIDAVFRAFHTIKGMSGFLALDAISEHAHESESLLAPLRGKNAAVEPSVLQQLFTAVDVMRSLVSRAAGEPEAARSTSAAASAHERPATVAAVPEAAIEGSSRQGTVRMDEARLDGLLDTIGELVIAESMLSSSTRTGVDRAQIMGQLERLDKITRELQHMATSLRMVPLRATFRRMARLVRDVAHKAGKDVEFVMTGEDTELDKAVVDRIQDPLIHALRNAVDHGIETAEQRKATGKPPTARVELHAFHAGGAIHIEIVDDGKGLDADRIEAKARKLGLVGENDGLGEEEIYNLVFMPGFSTAEKVTDVSGRGVGMDVVQRTVEELRGSIRLDSEQGVGTTVGIRLPVTLAIIDGMVCRVGSERYIVPVLAIERSVRPAKGDLSTVQERGMMLGTEQGLIPIVRLHDLLDVPEAETDPTQAVVVIIDEGGSRAGLLACELLGQQQTVIKPLGDGLPEQQGISGGAIMPDGRIGLILDAAGLVRMAHGKN